MQQYFMNEHVAHALSRGWGWGSGPSNYTELCRGKKLTSDSDRYSIKLYIKIDYKSVYRFVKAGALLHCEKMLPAAKMVQPRFIHKILREYI